MPKTRSRKKTKKRKAKAKTPYEPTPAEIAAATAKIRDGWIDANGVMRVSPQAGERHYDSPGIRVVSTGSDRHRRGIEDDEPIDDEDVFT